MGAVLGIAAFGRTQEKLAGTAANPTATTQTVTQNNTGGNFGSAPSFGGNSGGFGSAPSFGSAPAFGNQPLGGNTMSTAPAFGSTPAPTFNTAGTTCPDTGKPLGPAQSFPAL
jgi:hypothetical protein